MMEEDVRDDIQTLFRMLAARTLVIESLERRVEELERRLSEREAEVTGPRPVLSIVGTADRCESIGAGRS
jgi:hypothetical protein